MSSAGMMMMMMVVVVMMMMMMTAICVLNLVRSEDFIDNRLLFQSNS